MQTRSVSCLRDRRMACKKPPSGRRSKKGRRAGSPVSLVTVMLLAPNQIEGLISGPIRMIRRRPLVRVELLKGLVPTVDDDIRSELEEANMSPKEVFLREVERGGSLVEAVKATVQRVKDKSGDYENKYQILSDHRSYSNRELLDKDHVLVPPSLDDLNQQQPQWYRVLWSRSLFRLFVFLGAFFFFPLLCNLMNTFLEISPDEFDIINEQFTPGIGILYGTFVALTLDILYERQGKVQENASVEASLLSQVTQNILSLFRDEPLISREATQIIADQVRIIVYRSRGAEMLNIMRADPYARLLSLVDHYQRDKQTFTPHQESLIDSLRSEVPSLMEARAKRLSDEASALPPTHFLVLLLLTCLSLIGFTAATLSITDENGNPPLESGMVFAGLTAVYVLFYNFCQDMNDPFDGVYQIKRSSAASYLLQIKWIVANQPFGDQIQFDTRGLAPVFDGNEVYEQLGKEGARSIVDMEPLSQTSQTRNSIASSTLPDLEKHQKRNSSPDKEEDAETESVPKESTEYDTLGINGNSNSVKLNQSTLLTSQTPSPTATMSFKTAESKEPIVTKVNGGSSGGSNTETETTTQLTVNNTPPLRAFLPKKQTTIDTSSTTDEIYSDSINLDLRTDGDDDDNNDDDDATVVSLEEQLRHHTIAADTTHSNKPQNTKISSKMISHFQSVSGFSDPNTTNEAALPSPTVKTHSSITTTSATTVTTAVQSQSRQSQRNYSVAATYFRNMGGFHHGYH